MNKILFFILMFCSGLIKINLGNAQVPGLGYTDRTNPYSGWSGIVKGDNNTVGMAGATVALPNSVSSMEYNPAGFAMDVGGLAAQINAFTNKDPNLNHGDTDYVDYVWGGGTSLPPWGFGITYYSPTTEHSDTSEVSVREVRLAVARMFGDNLAIGLAFGLDKGIRKFSGEDMSGTHVAGQVGALYKIGNHWVLGASYTPAVTIGPIGDSLSPDVASFNQGIDIPNVFAMGLGFEPNRYFKAGFSFLGITGSQGTALLYDQSISNGTSFTIEPRLGASYILGEWHFLKVELAAGTYYEQARVDGAPNRTHGTFGLDVNPWFMNTGIGADIAHGYQNWSLSVGVDIVRIFRTFQTIPPDPVPFYEGWFPPILEVNNNGLADGFTKGEQKAISPPSASDVKNIVQDFPNKLNEKFGGTLPNAPKIETPDDSKKIEKKNHKKNRAKKKKNPPAKGLKAISPASGQNND